MRKTSSHAPSPRATIRQAAKRSHYDQKTIYGIIDQAIVATVAVTIDDAPYSIPMAIARIDNAVYLHGSRTSRLMKHLAQGHELSLCIVHVDGIVVARSGMHCSANYRSVVIHGKGQVIEENKAALLHQVVTALIPGSEGDFRDHLPKELKATTLIKVPLDESAAKIRTGGPIDDKQDLELPYWAGVIPIEQVYKSPLPADDLNPNIQLPDYARNYSRG